jgi:hypothetical protein
MTVFRAIARSFKIKNMRIAAYAWLFNLLFGIIVYWAFHRLFSLSAGDSLLAQDPTYYNFWTSLSEIFRQAGVGLPLILSVIFLLILLYLVATIFIAGGIYGGLINEDRTSLQNLFHLSCGTFVKMFRVFLINIVNFALALFICALLGFLFLTIQKATGNESLIKTFFYIWAVLAGLILMFSIALYDFSRIIRLREERNFIYSFKQGIKAVLANKINILIIFIFLLLAAAFLHLLMSVILDRAENVLPLILLLVLYQVFIWLKYCFKIIVMNTEVNLLAEPVIQPTEEIDSPA